MEIYKNEYPWILLSKQLPENISMNIIKYASHSIVTWMGDPCVKCFYVKKGAIRYYTYNENGSMRTFGIVLPGAFIGETLLLKKLNWLFTVETILETELLPLDLIQLNNLIKNDTNFALHLVEALASKLMNAYYYEVLAKAPVRKRIEELLKQFSTPIAKEINKKYHFTHKDIADLTGCHRVTATKIIKELLTK